MVIKVAVKTMRGVCIQKMSFFNQNSALVLMSESFYLLYDLDGIHSHQDLHEFLREAELMQSFDHENVVKLLGMMLIY